MPDTARVGQAEASSQERHLLDTGGRGSSTRAVLHCFPRSMGSKLDRDPSSRDAALQAGARPAAPRQPLDFLLLCAGGFTLGKNGS